MSNPTTTSLAARFSAGADAYARMWAPVLLPFGRRLLDELPLADAARVIDLATGVGSLLPLLADAAPQAHVVGLDLAPGMLAHAPPGFDLVAADASRLPFVEGAFDVATMAFGLFFVPEPRAALAEVRRVLRPGGVLALTSWHGEPSFPAHDGWLAAMREHGATIPSWPADATLPDRLADALRASGFSAVRTWTAPFDHRHDPERFVALRLALARPWLDSLPPGDAARFVATLTTRLSGLGPDDFVDPTPVLYARAVTACSG